MDKYYAIQVGDLTIGLLKADSQTYALFYNAMGDDGYDLVEISEKRCQEILNTGLRLFQQRSAR